MSDATPPEDRSQILVDYASQYIQKSSRVYTNVDQGIIFTTEDKLRLCLMEHLSGMERKNGWFAPLAIFLTILVVFPTTDFHPFLTFSADTWQAIFVMAGGISIIWLIRAILAARSSTSLDDVVANIKRAGVS